MSIKGSTKAALTDSASIKNGISKKTMIDLFLDITNFLRARNQPVPDLTFTRNASNMAFITTDGRALKADGSNAIPVLLQDDSASFIPSIGLIVEC